MEQNPQKYRKIVSVNGHSIVVAHQLPTLRRSYYRGGDDEVYEDLRTVAPDGWEEHFLEAQQILHSNKPLEDILHYLPEHSVVSYIGNPEIPTKIGVPENVRDLNSVKRVVKRWLELKTRYFTYKKITFLKQNYLPNYNAEHIFSNRSNYYSQF